MPAADIGGNVPTEHCLEIVARLVPKALAGDVD
jgi:hypothetical protein